MSANFCGSLKKKDSAVFINKNFRPVKAGIVSSGISSIAAGNGGNTFFYREVL